MPVGTCDQLVSGTEFEILQESKSSPTARVGLQSKTCQCESLAANKPFHDSAQEYQVVLRRLLGMFEFTHPSLLASVEPCQKKTFQMCNFSRAQGKPKLSGMFFCAGRCSMDEYPTTATQILSTRWDTRCTRWDTRWKMFRI